MKTPAPWEQPVLIEALGANLCVAREDLLPGGTKVRFLPALVEGATELVYGGPFCGGAALALSIVGEALGIPVTLFYAQRRVWHPRQLFAQAHGARLIPVPMGFQSHVSAKAKAYAVEHGALNFPLGFDQPQAHAALVSHLQLVREMAGRFDAIYTACSSGMLTTALACVWPEAEVVATCVGLKSRWSARLFPANVRLVVWPKTLDKPARGTPPPFDYCPFYERKAWEVLQREQPAGRILFWNVLGNVG